MKKIISILITLVLAVSSNTVSAKTVDLIKEFLDKNIEKRKIQVDRKVNDWNFEQLEKKRVWALTYSGLYYDNKADGSSSSNLQQITQLSNSLTLSKSTLWGGTFSLENTHEAIDRDRYSATTLAGSNPKIYQFYQTLSYSQDIGKNRWGRNDKLELSMGKDYRDEQSYLLTMKEETLVMSFFQHLLRSIYSKKILSLQKEALERAQNRTRLIRRMVGDGLRERVDLLQAQLVERGQEELLKTSEMEYKKSAGEVERLLHRKITEAELEELGLQHVNAPVSKVDWQQTVNFKSMKKRLVYLEKELATRENSVMPDIQLVASYGTNDYDEQSGTAISDGFLGNSQSELSIGVNLTWTIGQKLEEIDAQKARVLKMVKQKELEVEEMNFKLQETNIFERLAILEKNIESAKTRVTLSEKVLAEYNKLYRLGKSDLDQVIRSEEDVINIQKGFYQLLFEKGTMQASLAFIYGTLKDYLIK